LIIGTNDFQRKNFILNKGKNAFMCKTNKSTRQSLSTSPLKPLTMKRKINFQLVAIMIAAALLSLTSCKKDETDNNTKGSNTVDQNSNYAEQTFKSLGNLTEKGLNDANGMKSAGITFKQSENTCMTLTLDLSAIPYVLTIDFGTVNCMCEDGHYRRGKIYVTYTPGIGDSLSTVTTTTEDYFDNDNQVIGTRTVVYHGQNAAGHLNWDETVNGSIILANNAGTITYQSAHHFEQTEGGATPLILEDNVYEITGSASGATIYGQIFSNVITTALVYKPTCTYFVSGVIEITPAGEPVRTIDFGNGECDNLATLYVSGYTINLILP
jgi:hypothetical protein